MTKDDALELIADAHADLQSAAHRRITNVVAARELGASWREIGHAMKMSGEGAMHMVRRYEAKLNDEQLDDLHTKRRKRRS
jgi:hypothetical protein